MLVMVFLLSAALMGNAQQPPNTINTIAGGGLTPTDPLMLDLPGPSSVIKDSQGNLYIAAPDSAYVFELLTNGTLQPFAGVGWGSFAGDGGPASAANLGQPTGLAIDQQGNIYIADVRLSRIRKISNGIINTVVGSGIKCDIATGTGACADGKPVLQAELNIPTSIALDSAGNIYIADTVDNRIRVANMGGSDIVIAGTLIHAGTIQTIVGDGNPCNIATNPTCGDGGLCDRQPTVRDLDWVRPRLQHLSLTHCHHGNAGGKRHFDDFADADCQVQSKRQPCCDGLSCEYVLHDFTESSQANGGKRFDHHAHHSDHEQHANRHLHSGSDFNLPKSGAHLEHYVDSNVSGTAIFTVLRGTRSGVGRHRFIFARRDWRPAVNRPRCYADGMDHLAVLREKVESLRAEIAQIQESNERYRREHRNDVQAQVDHGQRHERLQAIQQELSQLADLGRRVRSVEQMKEQHRARLHLVDKAS